MTVVSGTALERRIGAMLWTGGIGLFLVAALSVFWRPAYLQVVVTIPSVGAGQVVIPLAYWAALATWAFLAATAHNPAIPDAGARVLVVGFATHAMLLLAQLAGRLNDATVFSSRVYGAYTHLFVAAVVTGGAAWTIIRFAALARGRLDALLELPAMLSALTLGVLLFRSDWTVATAAVVAGSAIGSRAVRSRFGRGARYLVTRVRTAWRSDRVFLVAIVAIAVALRLLYTRRVMTDPDFVEVGADGAVYDRLAWSLAQGHGIPEAFRAVYPLLLLGYVRFVATIYAVVGHSYFAVCAVQSVLGGFVCVGIFSIARTLFDRAVARVAAFFTAISFQLVFAAAALGHQAIDVVLTVAVVSLLLQATMRRWRGPGVWAVVGLLFGCAVAVRETNAFLLPFVLLWVLFALGRSDASRRTSWPAATAILAGAAVVLLPLVVPMVASADRRWLVRRHLDRLWLYDDAQPRNEGETAFVNPRGALSAMRAAPAAAVVRLTEAATHKFATQFFTQPYGGFDLVFLVKNTPYAYGMWSYAYALTIGGFFVAVKRALADRRRAAGIALVVGVIVFRTMPHLVMESEYRHRAPIEPFLILLASVGVVSLVRDGHWIPALPAGQRAVAG